MTNQKPYIQFNDYSINFQFEDGIWWIVAKDICDALDVDWHSQYKKLTSDQILKNQIQSKTIYSLESQSRAMVCIPEKFVYGWIFQLNSKNNSIQEYKWKCYELLYDHFKGTITQRQNILKERSATDLEIIELKNAVEQSEEWQRIKELEKKKKSYNSKLRNLDLDLINKQGNLFNQS